MKLYYVNEVFLSLQGEGARAGSANVFVRFAGCNRHCRVSTDGFDCDTDHQAAMMLSANELVTMVFSRSQGVSWVILTGGEPGLQVDKDLVDELHSVGFEVAIESNGTVPLRGLGLDWVSLSPKAELVPSYADELRYVLRSGSRPPKLPISAQHCFVSPAHDGDRLDQEALRWCIEYVIKNPRWRLSTQQHKAWMIP